MSIYLNKILPLMISPLAIIMMLIIIAAVMRRRLPCIVALIILYVTSAPIIAQPFFRWVEGGQLRANAQTIPPADAVVVLSGMVGTVAGTLGPIPEWGDSVDRLFGGIEVYRAGKAPRIIFTAGLLPWESASKPEGQVLRDQAIAMGIPARNILVTDVATNTETEAAAVRTLLPVGQNHIILVTSAFHMQRSRALFERAGFTVTPYPVDLRVTLGDTTAMDFLPSTNALTLSSIAWRELLGRGYYFLK